MVVYNYVLSFVRRFFQRDERCPLCHSAIRSGQCRCPYGA